MPPPILIAKDIYKTFVDAQHSVEILHGINLSVESGQKIAIVGASGSGKSTLLHILSTLDSPSSGDVLYNNESLLSFNAKQQAKFRNTELGFVYQFHHLLPEFTAVENVAMPCLIGGMKKDKAYPLAKALLDRVGLSHRFEHKPQQLSGGERQRVAIARALANKPRIIMADEPTGNLDKESSEEILDLIKDINQKEHTSFVIVTHDHELAKYMDITLTLVNGQFTAR